MRDGDSLRRLFERQTIPVIVIAVLAVVTLAVVMGIGPFGEPTPPESIDDATVTLETGLCNGTCPVYRIEVCGDGTVHYLGRGYTETAGYERYEISDETVRDLVETIYRQDFFAMDRRYGFGAADAQPTTVTVTVGGRQKTVAQLGRAGPEGLQRIQVAIEEIAGQRIAHNRSQRIRQPSLTDDQRC